MGEGESSMWAEAGVWEKEWDGVGVTGGLLYPQAVDVQMQSMVLRGPDGEPQPGLESQGRAASMPRLAAETQVGGLGGLGSWKGVGGEETWRGGACIPRVGFAGVKLPKCTVSRTPSAPLETLWRCCQAV